MTELADISRWAFWKEYACELYRGCPFLLVNVLFVSMFNDKRIISACGQVIYGDTDSIMIHTGLDDLGTAKMIGVKVIKEVIYKTIFRKISSKFRPKAQNYLCF